MTALSRCLGYSRQAYYKRQRWEAQRQSEEQNVLENVRTIRLDQPRVGCRKLQRMIKPQGIGRDQLFDLLRRHKLLVKQRRNGHRTTYAGRVRYPNRIKGQSLEALSKAMVADITYIRTREGYRYLFLVTHYVSRKILGYSLSADLTAQGGYDALQMALREMPNAQGGIHHSDRGLQYGSHVITELAESRGMRMSMTEEDHVYENAVAERVNGILKAEFLLGEVLVSHASAQRQVAQAITIYNNERLHTSLAYETPAAMYQKMCQLF